MLCEHLLHILSGHKALHYMTLDQCCMTARKVCGDVILRLDGGKIRRIDRLYRETVGFHVGRPAVAATAVGVLVHLDWNAGREDRERQAEGYAQCQFHDCVHDGMLLLK